MKCSTEKPKSFAELKKLIVGLVDDYRQEYNESPDEIHLTFQVEELLVTGVSESDVGTRLFEAIVVKGRDAFESFFGMRVFWNQPEIRVYKLGHKGPLENDTSS